MTRRRSMVGAALAALLAAAVPAAAQDYPSRTVAPKGTPIKAEIDRWTPVIKKAGVYAE